MPSFSLHAQQRVSQEQQQKLTPQLALAAKLLPMTSQELVQELRQKLDTNPLLELGPGVELAAGEPLQESLSRAAEEDEVARCSDEEYVPESFSQLPDVAPLSSQERAALRGEDVPNGTGEGVVAGDIGERREPGEEGGVLRAEAEWRGEAAPDPDAEARHQYRMDSITRERPVREQLLEQLRFQISPAGEPAVYRACVAIVENLDANGWLTVEEEEIVRLEGVSFADVNRAVALVQSLSPAGIGGRNLREVLCLQLERRKMRGTLAWKLCDGFLEELGRNRIPQIARSLKVSNADIMEAWRWIQEELKPRPLLELSTETAPVISPEVYVEALSDGQWQVRGNDALQQPLRMISSAEYLKRLGMENPQDASLKAYLREKETEASLLLETLKYRATLLEKLAVVLLQLQEPFFRQGDSALRPLGMAQVAEMLKVSESTVSRAIANKYIQTPWGLREFRSFFTGGYRRAEATGEGEPGTAETEEDISAAAVRSRIAQLVEAEDSRHPLSDEKISGLLAKEGLKVARRTVAKYRQILEIPDTARRRVHV